MKWSCMFASAALLCLALAPPATAQPEKDALAVVSDDALGFIVLNRMGETNEKLAALVKRMQFPLPVTPLAFVKLVTRVEKGLDEKGSAIAVLYDGPREGSEPSGVLFIPITDYKEFIGQLEPKDAAAEVTEITLADRTMLVAKKGGYAAMATAEHRPALMKALKGKASASTRALETWITKNDFAGVVTPYGVKVITTIALKKMDEVRGQLDNLPGEIQFVAGMFDGIVAFVKSVGTDVTHLGAGGRLDESGNLHLSARAVFATGSGFAKFGEAAAPVGEGGPLAGLPAGPFALAAGGSIGERVAQGLANLNVQVLKMVAKDLAPEKLKKLEQAYARSMKGVRGLGMALQVGNDKEPLFSSMSVVIRTTDATQYLDDYEQSLKDMSEILKDIPIVPAYEVRRVKAGGVSAIELTMDPSSFLPPDDDLKKMMESMFGPGGKMTASLAAVDGKNVIMRYTPATGLPQAIKAAKKGLATDAEIAKTAALLPQEAQWALYISPKGATDLANRAVKMLGGPNEIPGFPATPPLGAAAKLSAGGLELNAVLPAALLEQLGPYVTKLQLRKFQ
jgi:hypothetical protein